MKHFITTIGLIISFSTSIFAQAGGNEIYMQNNRYIQNKNYNANQEEVWNNRFENAEQKIVFSESNANEISFSVNVLMNRKADSYLAIFNITQNAKTAKEVNQIVNTKITGFLSKLKALSITKDDVFTDIISLIPVYDYQIEKKLFSKTYTEVPKGFELQKNLHIRFSDENLLDDILTNASKAFPSKDLL